MREWLARLRDWLRRDRLDAELAEELRFHREQLERAATTAGANPEEAAYMARRQLGNLPRHQEESRDRFLQIRRSLRRRITRHHGLAPLRVWHANHPCAPNPCCPPNWTGSGTIGVADIFGFLAEWFAGCP